MPKPVTPGSAPVGYRTGAAARIAGVPVETLRVWERRHRVVGPSLGPGGQRLYSATQVRRLGLIKQLVDLGNPVSSLARLSDAALAEMHATSRTLTSALGGRGTGNGTVRAAFAGPSLVGRLAAELGREADIDVVASCEDPRLAPQALAGTQADVIVVELPALLDLVARTVEAAREAVGATAAVVFYRFGQRDTIRRLRRDGFVVARLPMDPVEIEVLCRAALAMRPPRSGGLRPSDAVPAPRFDEGTLAELARASTAVYCECPRHLADLLRMLGSFERYSAECQNRSPEDAQLHQDLGRTAAEARVLLEDALLRIARAEGLELSPRGERGTR